MHRAVLSQMEAFRTSVARPVRFSQEEVVIAVRGYDGIMVRPEVTIAIWGIAIGTRPPQYVLYETERVDEPAEGLSGTIVQIARKPYVEPRCG